MLNPLKKNKLRTAGLASVNSAKFGMVRRKSDGTPRAHQGVDLIAEPKTEVFAVGDGQVVNISLGLTGYGYTVTLKLAESIYAFYAHLSKVLVKAGQIVSAGQKIALTGDTGNAKGMDLISKGSHLHFEIRTKQNCGIGLADRLDPLNFIKLDKE